MVGFIFEFIFSFLFVILIIGMVVAIIMRILVWLASQGSPKISAHERREQSKRISRAIDTQKYENTEFVKVIEQLNENERLLKLNKKK